MTTTAIEAEKSVLRKQERWFGTHKHVTFEVVNWRWEPCADSMIGNVHPTGNWNYYIYIHEASVPKEFRKQLFLRGYFTKWSPSSRPRWHYDYEKGLLADLDWHGGITFYDIEYPNGTKVMRCVKAGCDYIHYWDEGQHYNERCVANDARRTIDQLLEQVPLMRRNANGTYEMEE